MKPATLLAIAIALFPPFACAGEPPARVEIKLPTTRWDKLSCAPNIGVRVGPDGRTWYQFGWHAPEHTLQENMKLMESEVKQISPQVPGMPHRPGGLELALIGENGTAWFYTGRSNGAYRRLLGYDGRRWIEHAAEDGDYFTGDCPTRGELRSAGGNYSAGDIAWFAAAHSVHRFDGKSWITQFMSAALAVSPNGRYALANAAHSRYYWFFRDGAWSRLQPFGPLRTIGLGGPHSFVILDNGTALFSYGNLLIQFDPKHDGGAGQDDFSSLIRDVERADPTGREAASAKLVARGAICLPLLNEAAIRARDHEAAARFQQLVSKITADHRQPSALGGFSILGKPVALYHDRSGRLYVVNESITSADGRAGPGLLLIEPGGASRAFIGKEYIDGWYRISGQGPPILTPAADGIWLPRVGTERAAARLDFKTGTIADELPNSSYGFVQAVDREGRVYTTGHNLLTWVGADNLMVFTPGMPDTRLPLEVTTLAITRPHVATDGSVWGHGDSGLQRFDGTALKTIEKDHEDDAWIKWRLAAGADGVVLATDSARSFLFQGERKVDNKGQLKDLIKANRELLRRTFRRYQPEQTPSEFNESIALVADSAQNLWLKAGSELHVLAGDVWIDGHSALKKADAQASDLQRFSWAESTETGSMVPVGDGSKIFLYAWGNQALTRLWLADIKGAALRLERILPNAPYCADATPDGAGPVWFSTSGDKSAQMTELGVIQELSDVGSPLVSDVIGSVWFGRREAKPQNRICRWRAGRIVQMIDLPSTGAAGGAFCDTPGSIYVWTASGLQHLLADPPMFEHYRLGNVYSVAARGECKPYSSLGFLVFDNSTAGTQLIKLPKPTADAQK